jgi:hypothetical protein
MVSVRVYGWRCVMENASLMNCRKQRCANTIPPALAGERLCLDHFLDDAFVRTEFALEKCHTGQPIDAKSLESLLADALAIVNNLDEEPQEKNMGQRDRMLELLLLLANVHEFVAHQGIRPAHLC